MKFDGRWRLKSAAVWYNLLKRYGDEERNTDDRVQAVVARREARGSDPIGGVEMVE